MSENVENDEGIETIVETENKQKVRKFSWAKLCCVDSFDLEAGRVSSVPSHNSKVDWKKTLSLAFQSIWANLRCVDSFDMEAGRVFSVPSHSSMVDWKKTLSLAFQSIGVVYGDLGTSPLYVYSGIFSEGTGEVDQDDIIGVLSLIIYSLLLLPFLKYAFIVLRANDNGEGGTFALYSLFCRYADISLIPNRQPEDSQLSNYKQDNPSAQMKRAYTYKIKGKLESSWSIKVLLFLVTILGTSMVIGDGILTPSISVLSAVSGMKLLGKDAVVGVSVAILIALFSVQRFGTDKVGYSFAPIICLWFTFLNGIGLYNLVKHDLSVLRAFNPLYIVDYFRRNGKQGWVSLGGVVLCLTGTEAMFADLGHFNVRAIQISFSTITLPSLLIAYCGQAAYLTKYPTEVGDAFYKSIPGPLYWPTFVVAVLAAIIASQAMISGVFSIIFQSLTLRCFPRVKVVHTSVKYEGQVYIPEINYMLMIACIIVTVGFKTTEKIGNAYGLAVVAAMIITTFMVTLIMLVIWETSILWIALFFVGFGVIEVTYFSSLLYKFTQGGYLPLAFSFFLMITMGIWHYVHRKRYTYQLNNIVSNEYVKQLAENPSINRIPGIGLLYSELVQGIPPIFPHFIANIPCIHSVLVFVSIKKIPISKVASEARFLFRQVEPKEFRVFCCVVRYGYKDVLGEPAEFERQLVERLKEFIRDEYFNKGDCAEQPMPVPENLQHSTILVNDGKVRGTSKSTIDVEESPQQQNPSRVSSGSIRLTHSSSSIVSAPIQDAEEEMQFVQRAMEEGVVYLVGEAEVVAQQNASVFKKMVVNYIYSFLRRNFRQGEEVMVTPHARLLRVGMTYEI